MRGNRFQLSFALFAVANLLLGCAWLRQRLAGGGGGGECCDARVIIQTQSELRPAVKLQTHSARTEMNSAPSLRPSRHRHTEEEKNSERQKKKEKDLLISLLVF